MASLKELEEKNIGLSGLISGNYNTKIFCCCQCSMRRAVGGLTSDKTLETANDNVLYFFEFIYFIDTFENSLNVAFIALVFMKGGLKYLRYYIFFFMLIIS